MDAADILKVYEVCIAQEQLKKFNRKCKLPWVSNVCISGSRGIWFTHCVVDTELQPVWMETGHSHCQYLNCQYWWKTKAMHVILITRLTAHYENDHKLLAPNKHKK